MKISLSKVVGSAVVVLVFIAIGYWFGTAGLLSGGAVVAVAAGRARRGVESSVVIAETASSEISSAVDGINLRIDRLESSARESGGNEGENRSNHDPDSGLIVDRPRLRITDKG